METIKVVKIGGNVADNPEALQAFANDFAKLPGRKVLVHGGGKEATKLSEALGLQTVMIEGRRVTDSATLEVVTMVYAGLVNKRVVCRLQQAGCNALGLSGADAHCITATRRPATPIDYGFVGDLSVEGINNQFILSLCDNGIVPVICAIMHDGNGGLLNCNADSVATAVALGLARDAKVDLVFCFEKAGVLRDVDDPDSVIRQITRDIFPQLKESGIVSKGMIPKIENALKATESGVASVRICSSNDLLSDNGTVIRNI